MQRTRIDVESFTDSVQRLAELRGLGVDSPVVRRIARWLAARAQPELQCEAIDAVAQIRDQCTTAVVSETTTYEVLPLLRELEEYFDDVILSSQLGTTKRDGALWAQAAERLGSCIACGIGDDWFGDIVPLLKLGVGQVCWLPRRDDWLVSIATQVLNGSDVDAVFIQALGLADGSGFKVDTSGVYLCSTWRDVRERLHVIP